MNLAEYWNASFTGWWVQPMWVVVAVLGGLHVFLRAIHIVVTWPTDRRHRFAWFVVSVAVFAYFFAAVHLNRASLTVKGADLARNFMHIALTVMLFVDVLVGIRGTLTRRANAYRRTQTNDDVLPPA